MSFEAMETLAAVEETVKRMHADAAAASKQALADAVADGERMITAAIGKAEAELAELVRKADEKGRAGVQALADSNANRKAALGAKAEARAEKAAAFIVERIVNG